MKERIPVQTSLLGIANKAKSDKRYRFRNLYRELNEELLLDSWRLLRKDAALGVDRVSAAEYEANLEENIHQLVARLKRKSYRARLVRRHYIPKGNGGVRPLGIPGHRRQAAAIGSKAPAGSNLRAGLSVMQLWLSTIVGARTAVDELRVKLQFGGYHHLVEADIKGYFDHLSHEWLMRMLAERIDDEPFLRLIKKWLKAGVLDTDGQVLKPESGTPQGGIVSPVLANVYLHYALDLWFERVFQRSCRGAAFLHRYADDFVCGFGRVEEAERFYHELEERLRKFGLELAQDKTRVIPFSRYRQGETGFEFLGFEFRWGVNRKGHAWLKRRTARKKLRNSLKRVTEWCRQNRHRRVREQVQLLNAKLRGYKNYYGVSGNSASLDEFFYQVRRIHQRWLNQRSQRRSYTWAAYNELMCLLRLEQPRIMPAAK